MNPFDPFRKVSLFRFQAALLLLGFPLLVGAKPTPGDLMMQESASYRAEGRRLQAVGDLKGAQEAYQKAIIANPRYADPYNDLGVILESQGNLSGAEQAYQSSLRVNPNLVGAHSNLALLYEQQGRVKEAAEHWIARIHTGPPDDPGVIKAKEKLIQYKMSLPETSAVLARKRKSEISNAYDLGREALRENRFQEAIGHFERILALSPAHEKAQSSLGEAKWRMKKEEEEKARAAAKAQEEALNKAQKRMQPAPPPARLKAESPPVPASGRVGPGGRAAPQPRIAQGPPAVPDLEKKKLEQARKLEEARRAELTKVLETKRREQAKKVEAPPRVEAPKVEPPKKVEKAPLPKGAWELAQALAKEKEGARNKSIRELMQQAVSQMRQGNYSKAVDHFRQVLLLDPGNREAAEGLKRAQAALEKAAKRPAANSSSQRNS
jgi:Flp pilus assembly protein TadD